MKANSVNIVGDTAIESPSLERLEFLDKQLEEHYKSKLITDKSLTRSLVSFQANKKRKLYRWYKYKEAFSAGLVEFLLNRYGISEGNLLDPFAGIGTALFASAAMGMDVQGIELLPLGSEIIRARSIIVNDFTDEDFNVIKKWIVEYPWENSEGKVPLVELRITAGAYPKETRESIERYIWAYQQENDSVQSILKLALFCILESISYTRKDGQYLRWDSRADRRLAGKPFDKGEIKGFKEAITTKLQDILYDVNGDEGLFPNNDRKGSVHLIQGSCLEELPKMLSNSFDAIITSPPYCNRYDYTRTYALELALLGLNEQDVANLRQQMVTCTVENRVKDLISINPSWNLAISAADDQELLQEILNYLENLKKSGELNNANIPRLVRGYFYELTCVIAECARVLKPNGILIMINDNVRYAGASISVDIILSNIAEKMGFKVENILVLPKGKGNSSQQMGVHGRKPLRKCVYVWRKANEGQ